MNAYCAMLVDGEFELTLTWLKYPAIVSLAYFVHMKILSKLLMNSFA